MKAKDLISILSSVHPETEVWFQLGESDNEDYRDKCAKAELLNGECLNFISKVKRAEIEEIEGELKVSFILNQDNYQELNWVDEEFEKHYKYID